jgi:uncharacterized ferritin-like protein (DUF455 family)
MQSTWRWTLSGDFPLPETFYRDWLDVAQEEALHFQLLAEHLQTWVTSTGIFRHMTDSGTWPTHP